MPHISFSGGATGDWRIDEIAPVVGNALPDARMLKIGSQRPVADAWTLTGFVSNTRYANREEIDRLQARQEGLNRPTATRGALIPIKKTDGWWALAQDERRAIMEEQSRHIAIGMEYLPAIARRLHHCRDLGEPFDFLTWFEYAPEHAQAFEDLVKRLRETREWDYVEREVDIRLVRG